MLVLQNICCPLSSVLVVAAMFDISLVSKAYHLRREETDWFDKPRESRLENGHGLDRKLPERLVHSRPVSQHQEQVSAILRNLFQIYPPRPKKSVSPSISQSVSHPRMVSVILKYMGLLSIKFINIFFSNLKY